MKVQLLYYKYVGNTYDGGVCVIRYRSHGDTHGTTCDRFPSDTDPVGLTGRCEVVAETTDAGGHGCGDQR